MRKLKYLYELQHIDEIRKSDEEELNVKRLGIYASKKEANEAIEIYKKLPGFSEKMEVFDAEDDYTEGFCISTIVIGTTYWEGGFTPSQHISIEKETEIKLNLPAWFSIDTEPNPNESSMAFAQRIMQQKYHTVDYPTDPQSEFEQIKKFKELQDKQLV